MQIEQNCETIESLENVIVRTCGERLLHCEIGFEVRNFGFFFHFFFIFSHFFRNVVMPSARFSCCNRGNFLI